jgi:hypothetical protein
MKIAWMTALIYFGQPFAFDCSEAFKIVSVSSKGRIQDGNYNPEYPVDSIIYHHEKCFPYLISMIDNKEITRVEMCCKGAPTKGELARIYIANLFTMSDWKTSSIAGLSWKELEAISLKPGGPKKAKLIYDSKKHGIVFSRKENCFVFQPIKVSR